MHAEYAILDDGCDWHAVEAIHEALPQFDVVATLACIA